MIGRAISVSRPLPRGAHTRLQTTIRTAGVVYFVGMKKKELKDLLNRVETWPKADQEAAFDSLSMIEEERHIDPALAEDIIRSREDIKHDRLTSQDALIKELHLFGH